MKIVLVDPPGVQEGLNVGLGYIVSSLVNAGHDGKVLDLNNSSICEGAWIKMIREYDPRVIGFSIKNATYFKAVEIAGKIKKLFPGIVLVAGGPYVTLAGNDFFKDAPFFDYAILGEGEKVFPELCDTIASGGKVNIKGVISRNSTQKEADPVFVEDLDDLDPPTYELFENFEDTMSKSRYPVITSRGCPYNCIYCSVCAISGRKWRTRSIQKVIEEITEAEKKHAIKGFEILDDNFTLDVERAKKFCRTLIKEKVDLPWSCPNGIRTDRIDDELAELMMQSGCDLVMVGVESADEEVFNQIDKGETLADIGNGIKTLKKAGIRVGGYFIIGLPGDSLEATKKSVEFARKNGLEPAHFNMLAPYPKTRMWNWIQENGRMLEDYRMGKHFLGKPVPVFETDDFTTEERVKAYYMANTVLRQYEFVIPRDYSRMRRIMRKIKLTWDYDRGNLIHYLGEGLQNRLNS